MGNFGIKGGIFDDDMDGFGDMRNSNIMKNNSNI